MKLDKNIKKGLKVFLFFLLIMVSIITCAGVWNGVAAYGLDAFYGWVAGLDFIASGVGLYFLARKWIFKKED